MKEFILACILTALTLSTGVWSLEKYKEDTNTIRIPFWKGLLIVVGYSIFSIIIIPTAIAKWAVNLTLDFKKE